MPDTWQTQCDCTVWLVCVWVTCNLKLLSELSLSNQITLAGLCIPAQTWLHCSCYLAAKLHHDEHLLRASSCFNCSASHTSAALEPPWRCAQQQRCRGSSCINSTPRGPAPS
jgi:hypothetical protein